MDIMLEIVSRQKFSASFPVSHVFGEAGGYIGRSKECEWVLPDKAREISRKHALITFEDNNFYIEDVSSNGIYLSLAHEPIGKNTRRRIEHGEGFIIGSYTLMARLLQNPNAYTGSASGDGEDILSRAKGLSLDPLTAMVQEEELIARKRMGEFDDLLGARKTAAVLPADHTDPLHGRLQAIRGIPAEKELIPENWDAEPELEPEHDDEKDNAEAGPRAPRISARTIPTPQATVLAQADATAYAHQASQERLESLADAPDQANLANLANTQLASKHSESTSGDALQETELFFKALGFAEPPASAKERKRILRIAAELLVTAVDGMSRALHNRAECKNELRLPATRTGLAINNNPLKFSPTAEAALACLLGPPQKGVMPPTQAMAQGFNDLHTHHLGLLAGARAATAALLEKIEPQAVERRLNINGPVHFNRTARLWQTYARMHRALCDDHDGMAALLLQDFARAYEMQGRTLNPHGSSPKERTSR